MPEDHASSADPPVVRGAAAPPGEMTCRRPPCPRLVAVAAARRPRLPGSRRSATTRARQLSFACRSAARSLVGVVWDGASGELPVERLKPVVEALPIPQLRPELRRFVERVAAYTMAPPGTVLRMTMSVAAALEAPRPRRVCARPRRGSQRCRGTAPEIRADTGAATGARGIARRAAAPAAELARAAGCGPGVIRALVACGLVEERLAPAEPPLPSPPDWRLSGPPLSPDQSIAARRLVDARRGAAASA